MSTELFLIADSDIPAILLVDTSGSVKTDFVPGHLTFDYIKLVIKKLPENDFRIIFWNSDNQKDQNCNTFKNGICKLTFIVKKSTIDQSFDFIKQSITSSCLTFPHLGFDNIPGEWINKTKQTKIYFVTDGEMGYQNISSYDMRQLKNVLSESIITLFKKHNNVQLNIITVEKNFRDFTRVESLTSAAGCDVYDVIMNNKLTKYITKFISYTPNNLEGFVHINKNIPPTGFIPYGDKYFSELKMNEFIQYIINEIVPIKDNDTELLKIIQLLSSSICTIIHDKPQKVKKDIIDTFCKLFNNTALDVMFAKFILTDAINKENDGMANIFATYRAKLQDLYKQANELLADNVKDAIGVSESFLSLPMKNGPNVRGEYKCISGHYRLIDKPLIVSKKNYPQSAVTINDIGVPIVPFDNKALSPMNEQCLRQWLRQLVGKMYGLNVMEDIIIYVVLGMVLRVAISECPVEVLVSFRKLGSVMLKKKRMNTDVTELERLERGELPIPNSGKIENFYKFMDVVSRQLGVQVHSMTLWYALCMALDNKMLIKNQYVHCKEFIETDFPGINVNDLLTILGANVEKVNYVPIPYESILDYTCLITLEDTKDVGGYKFKPHNSMSNNVCCPMYVLSEQGFAAMTSVGPLVCPICYAHIQTSDFELVGPKPLIIDELKVFDEGTVNVFDDKVIVKNITVSNVPVASNNINVNKVPISSKNRLLIVMKGCVGSGKSTIAMKLKDEYEKQGKHCFVEGTDKYRKDGLSHDEAISSVKQNLQKIDDIPEDEFVAVCIDTCGETVNKSTNDIFGYNFAGWPKVMYYPNLIRKELEGYLAWSLRNVLRRGNCTEPGSNFWLSPEGAGFTTCISVHDKKAKAHFGKKIPKLYYVSPSNLGQAIDLINDRADDYEELLKVNMPLDNEISKIIQ